MSDELSSLETLAADFVGGIYRLSPISLAVLFYASRFWGLRGNWRSNNPYDVITDSDWDTIQAYCDGLLYEVKTPVIGYIFPFITESPPTNALACDGSTYLREDYPELYAALDTFFIIDADSFFVPDLRGRTVIGAGDGSGLTTRTVGEQGGEEDHQLDISELASHDHTIPLTATTLAVEPGEVTVLTPIPFFTQNTGLTGGDSPHNNMQPFYALNYGIIAS